MGIAEAKRSGGGWTTGTWSAVLALLLVSMSGGGAKAQQTSYSLALYGGRTIYPGYDAYQQVTVRYSGPIGHLYFNSITVPGGFKFQVLCETWQPCPVDAQGRPWFWNERLQTITPVVRFTAPPDAVPGDYAATVTTEVLGVVQAIVVPLHVATPASATAPEQPSGPAIPGMKKWRSEMQRLGTKWCNPSQTFSFGWEQEVWYYDGARVYFQVGDYLNDPKTWYPCALNVASQYADYLIAHNGSIGGWRVFPHGLRMAYERTKDEKYRQALVLLASGSPYAKRGGGIVDDAIRETAYITQAYIEAEKVGEPRNPLLARSVDFLLGNVDTLFSQHAYVIHQTFFDGLAAAALIDYYGLTQAEQKPDPRIVPAIKQMLDWMWEYGWDQHRKKMVYDPDVVPREYSSVLVNLIVPAFAWYYNVTGDATYQRRGDELFAHALDEDISYSGKIFSQNYRWSFDYVRWRNAANPSVGALVPEHLTSARDATATLAISGPASAPCGQAIHLFSSNPDLLNVPESIAVPAGEWSVDLLLRPGQVASPATVDLGASYRGTCKGPRVRSSTPVQIVPDHLHFLANTPVQPGGSFANNRIILDGTVPQDGYNVELSSDQPDLIAFRDLDGAPIKSLTIRPDGYATDYFVVQTSYVEQATVATLTATTGPLTGSTQIQIIPPPGFTLKALRGTAVTGGGTQPLNEIVLKTPAPPGGAEVSLTASDPTLITVPAVVTIPEGKIEGGFAFRTPVVAAAKTGTITASYGGNQASLSVTVGYLQPNLIANSSIVGGQTGSGSVRLVGLNGFTPAPDDITVSLSASSGAPLTVPAEVRIPKGATAATFPIQTTQVAAATAVTVTANMAGQVKTVTVTVQPK